MISTGPPPQRTSQLGYPVVLHVAQSYEAFPEDCPIGAVVFPSPVPSVVLWFSVELLRLSNISDTPETHTVVLALSVCQCGSSTAGAWMWRSVHFAERKFPFSSKVLQSGLRIGKRPKKWVIRSVMVLICLWKNLVLESCARATFPNGLCSVPRKLLKRKASFLPTYLRLVKILRIWSP